MTLPLIEGRKNVKDKRAPMAGVWGHAGGGRLRPQLHECLTWCAVLQLPHLFAQSSWAVRGGGRRLQGGLLDMEEGGRDLTL